MDGMSALVEYEAFLKAKAVEAPEFGFEVDPVEVHPLLKPHQRDIVVWACRRGRAALFEAFGLGKTMQQLEIVRLVLSRAGGRGLIVLPLGVRQEFRRDAEKLGIEVRFVRTIEECGETGIYLTNYETVRESKHGFAYLGMKTVVTDVVRENNQTYRLGWTEQCKDGSRMGVGMPEYLLIFRKPPTDGTNGYADVPVVKDKGAYTRARWQFDAHGFMRSSGERLLSAGDLEHVPHERIFKLFRQHSLTEVYDHESDVALGEALESEGRLPPTFMLLQPQSWHPDVWSDVTRMKTLNSLQYAKGKELHLCPLQFDIVDRVVRQMSNPGDLVFDPFSGLGTVALRALKLGRRGYGVELSASYHADAVYWLRKAEGEAAAPNLFSLLRDEGEALAVGS